MVIEKGIIRKIDNDILRAYVYIPIFQNSNTTNAEILFCCPYSYHPGNIQGYAVGDVVYVGFENDDLDYPFIIGKLYTVKDTEAPSTQFKGNALRITGKTVLSDDTTIGDITYAQLSNLITRVNALDDNTTKAMTSITNLEKDSVTSTKSANSSSDSGSGLAALAYSKVVALESQVSINESRITKIEDILNDLIYQDLSFSVSPTWKLDADYGYMLVYSAKNVNEHSDHTEYVKDIIPFASYDYCNFDKTIDDSDKATASYKHTFYYGESKNIQDLAQPLTKNQGAWITENWKSVMRISSDNSTKGLGYGFPQMYCGNDSDLNQPTIVISNVEDGAKAPGTQIHYLNLDMTNRQKSNVFITPDNTGLTISPRPGRSEVKYDGNLWYPSPAIITEWSINFSGSTNPQCDSSGRAISNNVNSVAKINFTIGNVKQLAGLETANIRMLLKIKLNDGTLSCPMDSSGSTAVNIKFNNELLYLCDSNTLINTETASGTINLDLRPALKAQLEDIISELHSEQFSRDIAIAAICSSIATGKDSTSSGTVITSPMGQGDVTTGTWTCNIKISDITIEYFYTADCRDSNNLSKVPVSLPICYKLRESYTDYKDLNLITEYSTYQQTVGPEGMIFPISTGDQLNAPEINWCKIIVSENSNPILRLSISNKNYISGEAKDTDVGLTLTASNAISSFRLAFYDKDTGELYISDVSELPNGYKVVSPATYTIKNSYYKQTDDSGKYIPDTSKWISYSSENIIDISLPTFTNISYTDYAVAMEGIAFTRSGNKQSATTYINNWQVCASDALPKILAKISTEKTEIWERYRGAIEVISVPSENYTITFKQFPEDSKWYDPDRYWFELPEPVQCLFVPNLPVPETTANGNINGALFNRWYYRNDGETHANYLKCGDLLTKDLILYIEPSFKSERLYISGEYSNAAGYITTINQEQKDSDLTIASEPFTNQFEMSINVPYNKSLNKYMTELSSCGGYHIDFEQNMKTGIKTGIKDFCNTHNFTKPGTDHSNPWKHTAFVFSKNYWCRYNPEWKTEESKHTYQSIPDIMITSGVVEKLTEDQKKTLTAQYSSDNWYYYFTRISSCENTDTEELVTGDSGFSTMLVGRNLDMKYRTYKLHVTEVRQMKFYQTSSVATKDLITSIKGASRYIPILNNTISLIGTDAQLPLTNPLDPKYSITKWSNKNSSYGQYVITVDNQDKVQIPSIKNDSTDFDYYVWETKQLRNYISVWNRDDYAQKNTPVTNLFEAGDGKIINKQVLNLDLSIFFPIESSQGVLQYMNCMIQEGDWDGEDIVGWYADEKHFTSCNLDNLSFTNNLLNASKGYDDITLAVWLIPKRTTISYQILDSDGNYIESIRSVYNWIRYNSTSATYCSTCYDDAVYSGQSMSNVPTGETALRLFNHWELEDGTTVTGTSEIPKDETNIIKVYAKYDVVGGSSWII